MVLQAIRRLSVLLITVLLVSCAQGGQPFDPPIQCNRPLIEYCEGGTGSHIKTKRHCRCISIESACNLIGIGRDKGAC